ncbi:DUF222 domain-containing protein [Klenkia terrae]|uniref:DUF222 domain-containing protein n=1 Tax=Klenkia terrae TaxID=1052259 RepID=UPI00361A44BB
MGLDSGTPPRTTPSGWVPEALPPGALGADRAPASSSVAAARRLPEPPPDDVAAVIDALLTAVDAELSSATSAQLLDRARGLARAQNLITTELARVVAHAETHEAASADGLTGMRPWLRGHVGATGPEAAAVLAAGRVLERMPVLAAAAAEGAVSHGQLGVIGRILTADVWATGEAAGMDMTAADQAVTDTITGDHPRTLTQVCQRIADLIDPDGPAPADPTAGRFLRITRRADGSRTIRGSLDAAGGEKAEAALESIAASSRCDGDLRTSEQRSADALVQLADLQLAAGNLPVLRKVKPQLTALIQLEDLADPTGVAAAATLGSGATASSLVARQAACDADIARIVLGPDSLPWTSAELSAWSRPTSAEPRKSATAAASSPAATPPPGGATPTTSSTGSTAATPRSTTPLCSANATTPRSTTASRSAGTRARADGAPIAPTAPRS